METPVTVVIGDNSAASSRSLAEAFQAGGARVVETCSDGLALLRAVINHRPSVVVLDLILPKLTGLQVIEALRRKDFSPAFVVASAVSSRDRAVAAREAGVSYYILKPLDAQRLTDVASRLASKLAPETH